MRSPCLVSKSDLCIKYHKSQFYSSLKDLKLHNEGAQEQESGPEGSRGAEQRRLLGLNLAAALNCVAEDLTGDAAPDCIGRGELFAMPGGLGTGRAVGDVSPGWGSLSSWERGALPCLARVLLDGGVRCLPVVPFFFWIFYVWLFCKCDLGTCFLGRCSVTR